MKAERLQDRVARALGQAAHRIGEEYTVFRPRGAISPLDPENRLLRLNVALHGEDKDWHRSARFGQPLWFAVHDTAYTQPGDYLRGAQGIFFIAAQPPLLSTVCVRTNRVLRVSRAEGARLAGHNGYGGVTPRAEHVLLEGWPASVLMASAGARAGGTLPGEPGPASWTILLPLLTGCEAVALQPDDRITDDTGTTAIITAVEGSDLGWRLTAAQAVP